MARGSAARYSIEARDNIEARYLSDFGYQWAAKRMDADKPWEWLHWGLYVLRGFWRWLCS